MSAWLLAIPTVIRKEHTFLIPTMQNLSCRRRLTLTSSLFASIISYFRSTFLFVRCFCPLRFSLSHFGKLYGAGHVISAIFGSVQYALFVAVEDNLEKDPFWVSFKRQVSYNDSHILASGGISIDGKKEKLADDTVA